MATTAIFAEILIVGLQACVWLALFLTAVTGPLQADISFLKGWEGLASTFVLGVAYALGILVDRLADSLLSPVDKRLRDRWLPRKKGEPSISQRRLRIMATDEGMAKFLDYLRSRVRIARSTAFNVLLILTGLIVLGVQEAASYRAPSGNKFLLVAGIIGPLLLALSLFAWARISKTYYRRLDQAYRISREGEATPGDKHPQNG
jgi:hypothetical protein